jgi:hypothetical protein
VFALEEVGKEFVNFCSFGTVFDTLSLENVPRKD